MFSLGRPFLQTVFRLAVCLLVVTGLGCGPKLPWSRGETGPLLESVKVSELRPGDYCEIEMVVPPLSPEDSFHCFKGTVKEINHDEIVLTDVLEGISIEYGTTSGRRPFRQEKRDLVRVPLTGIDEIWAFPPGKTGATANPPSKPTDVKLPSNGAQPLSPPRAAPVAATEEAASPPAASRFLPPPQPEGPAHFDAPPVAGSAAR